MKPTGRGRMVTLVVLALWASPAWAGDDKSEVKEKSLEGPNGLAIKIRMEGPTTADVPLQIVCYFKYTAELAKKVTGAPVELDKELGGVIGALRERGEF